MANVVDVHELALDAGKWQKRLIGGPDGLVHHFGRA
jgi:hypothetical protein